MTNSYSLDGIKLPRIRIRPADPEVVKSYFKKKPTKRDKSSDPVTIRGIEYFDHYAAADEFGVTVEAIHNARNSGKLDSVGMGCGSNNRKAVWVGEKLYPSLRKASEAHGVNPWYFSEIVNAAKSEGKDTVFTKYGWVKLA